jgi:hypothetical protein
MEQYERHGMSTEGVVQKFEDQLVAMGFSRREAHKYARELQKVKDGLDAIPNVTKKTFQWVIKGAGPHGGHPSAVLEVKGHARGGTYRPGEVFIAGEEGPELIIGGSAGGRVMNNTQTMRALNSGAGSEVRARFEVSPGATQSVERLVADLVQRHVKVYLAGDATRLGGARTLA